MGTHKVARHFGLVSFVITQPALFWAFSIESPDFLHFLGFPLLFFTPRALRSTPRVSLNSIPTRLGSALSQSKSTALQSLPSCSRRPQPSQSVIVLSSQFHSLLPHSLPCTVFLALAFLNSAPRFSQFNLYSASSSARWRFFLRTALAAPRPVAPSREISAQLVASWSLPRDLASWACSPPSPSASPASLPASLPPSPLLPRYFFTDSSPIRRSLRQAHSQSIT